MDAVVWVLLTGCAVVLAVQLGGDRAGPVITTLQTLTPWLLPVALSAALLAVTRQQWTAGVAGAAVLVGYLAVIAPLVLRSPLPSPAGDARLTVLHANLLYRNPSFASTLAVLERADTDVIAVSELTPAFAGQIAASSIGQRYPYSELRPTEAALGIGLWSKRPFTVGPDLPGTSTTLVVGVDHAGRQLRIVLTHPIPPIFNEPRWRTEFDALAAQPAVDVERSLIVGDLNVSYYNPPLRRLLADTGTRAVHIALGKGFGSSWPTHRRWLPAFVRLDHALVGDQVTATAIEDLDLPGSDHRAFTVTVTWAAPDDG
jgi:endonuclease/exonuclease/phosphatase (EEP) superfamily protein YafD